MAFSLRKMLSNITYFKKPGEDENASGDCPTDPKSAEECSTSAITGEPSDFVDFEITEPDSTSKQATSLNLTECVKNFATKKGSLSDTDLLTISVKARTKKEKRRSRKLKLDIMKASKSTDEDIFENNSDDVENTPKHILLECQSSEIFSERLKKFDFNKSFDLFDDMSDEDQSSFDEANVDIKSLSDSDSISLASNDEEKVDIKMCRKVDSEMDTHYGDGQLVPSQTPESFGDVEIDKNEDERITMLLNYQMRLEKMECFLKKLLSEFQFHIEVSKIFHCRSIVTTLPGTDVSNIPKVLGEINFKDSVDRGISPTGSWNIILEKEDNVTKFKLKKQLKAIKHCIDEFVECYLKDLENEGQQRKMLSRKQRSITFDLHKNERIPHKRIRISNKKKLKHYDFPDIRDAMVCLFGQDTEKDNCTVSPNDTTLILSEIEEPDRQKCVCSCHMHSPSSQSDSGLTSKSNDNSRISITSSLGNFSVDNTTLTAYSESLDLIVSYNSFQDTSLYSTLLQKAAIERITFYIQVHSIQLKCEPADEEYESKNIITFHCPTCKITENEENGLLKHILSQMHCEKIHFLYKTAYIKKCVTSGKEIQPSTVLNPMKMYRDVNKIVCFGDAMYACSLCFENIIVGESVLMAHCSEQEHIDRRERLAEMID